MLAGKVCYCEGQPKEVAHLCIEEIPQPMSLMARGILLLRQLWLAGL